MCGDTVIELQKMLCGIGVSSWSPVEVGFLKTYLELPGSENPDTKHCNVQTRIDIRCVMYDVRRPELAGILVVMCGRT